MARCFSTTSMAVSSRSSEMVMTSPSICSLRKLLTFACSSGLVLGNLTSVTLTS